MWNNVNSHLIIISVPTAITVQRFAWWPIKEISFKWSKWIDVESNHRQKNEDYYTVSLTALTILLLSQKWASRIACVCVLRTIISQLLPNYTNGTLNRWRMEEDFARPSMSDTNIRRNFPCSWYTQFVHINREHHPVKENTVCFSFIFQPRYVWFDYICRLIIFAADSQNSHNNLKYGD